MKQHITYEQIQEIDAKIVFDLFGFHRDANTECDSIIKENRIHPSVTIGKMIEILNNEGNLIIIKIENEWTASLVTYLNSFDYDSDELCDALWEAVKEVLK